MIDNYYSSLLRVLIIFGYAFQSEPRKKGEWQEWFCSVSSTAAKHVIYMSMVYAL